MTKILKHNGLSIVLAILFLGFLFGHSVAGYYHYNQEQQDHRQPTITYPQYLVSGDFLESVAENFESEFLQMGAFVILSTHLYQKGSSESKDPDEAKSEEDEDPRKHQHDKNAPWPVRKGGIILALYEHSMSTAFFILFAISIFLHAVGGHRVYNQQQLQHGGETITFWQFWGTSEFWYQSFQNWQSEFLAIFCMVVFSIFLRDRCSPQSKPVHAPYSETTG